MKIFSKLKIISLDSSIPFAFAKRNQAVEAEVGRRVVWHSQDYLLACSKEIHRIWSYQCSGKHVIFFLMSKSVHKVYIQVYCATYLPSNLPLVGKQKHKKCPELEPLTLPLVSEATPFAKGVACKTEASIH